MSTDQPRLRCLVISDANLENLAGLLTNDAAAPALRADAAPFGQVAQVLLDAGQACWATRPDAALVWTRPQGVIEPFARLLAGEAVSADHILDEVDAYAARLLAARLRAGCLLVASWTLPAWERGGRLHEMRPDGIGTLLMRMNLRLAERLAQEPGVYLLDAQRWIEAGGRRAWNPKLWHMAKIPFGHDVLQEAARDVKAALAGLYGQARKLIVVDLDETLWGGIVGEVGWSGLVIGGHDPLGEAYAAFQRALARMAGRGILLAIVSKNDEAVALEALRRHPEVVLRPEAFAGWRINWLDKAQNIVELARELRLGLHSVVFIDDHPAERGRVREALPEVLVPDWPAEAMLFEQALLCLPCFETAAVTREDRDRAQLYADERRRAESRGCVGSLEEWLASLGTTVTIEALSEANLPRAAQLLNKTNQMNLSTRRMAEPELSAWAAQPGRRLWTVRVADRFGDAGLTGLLSVEIRGSEAWIVDFVLSCRVMGRKVEETMVALAVRHARAQGMERVMARLAPTERNAPCLEFWRRSGFSLDADGRTFRWDAAGAYPLPAHVSLADGDAGAQRPAESVHYQGAR